MESKITNPKVALEFLLAGNAHFTIVSQVSGTRFTYRATRSKKVSTIYFVSLLNGPQNDTNYTPMGMIGPGKNTLTRTLRSGVTEAALSWKAFNWAFSHLKQGTMPGFEFWHEGRCGRCGRRLTVPQSIAAGIGPECATMMVA